MNYAEPLSNQIVVFIRSVGLGVLLGFVYEIFSVLRTLLSDKRWAYIICDLCFCFSATLMSFFFMVLYNGGTVRLNLILAQAAGGVAFHLSVGTYLARPLMFICCMLRKALLTLFYPVRFISKKLQEAIKRHQKDKGEDKKVKKDRKKIKNIMKIPLKK
ncbi:MAG: spore cortex biosynthesis protein YabQ [Clostridia bacterium]|nr:spore cortex biosynthesis protein YabQ [Clostridia bacterium]